MKQRDNYIFKHEQLKNYCYQNASLAIIQRGQSYYTNNHIIAETDIANDPPEKEFMVMGSDAVYIVKVRNYNNDKIAATCNCPYNWGEVCKHQVAVLMHIDDTLKLPEKEQIEPQIKAPTIIGLEELATGYLSKYMMENLISHHDFHDYNFRIQKLFKEKVRCLVHNGFYWDAESNTVTISNHPKGLELKCTCNNYSKPLCYHQVYALSVLLEQEYFPMAIVPSEQKKLADKFLFDLGLSGKASSKGLIAFKLTPLGEIDIELNSEYESILSVNPVIRKTYTDAYLSMGNSTNELPVDIPEQPIEEHQRKARYAIAFAFLSNDNPAYFEIAPIAGKLNKAETAIISNFSYYDEECSLPIIEMEEDENRLRLCNKISIDQINKRLMQKGIPAQNFTTFAEIRESCHLQFQYLPTIVDHIHAYPYIYRFHVTGQYNLRPNFKRGDLMPVSISKQRANLFYRLSEDDLFAVLKPMLEIEGEEFSLDSDQISYCSFLFVQKDKVLYLINGEEHAMRLLMRHHGNGSVKIVKEQIKTLIEEFVIPLSSQFDIKFDQISNYNMEEVKLKPVKRKLYITGEGNFVLFKPVVEYTKGVELEVLKRGFSVSLNGHIIQKTTRDLKYEEEFENMFRELHPTFSKQFPYEFYNLKATQMVEKFWFFDAFEKLQENHVEVFGLNDLKNFKFNPNKAIITTNLRSGKDWFEAEVDIAFGDNKIALNEVKKAILKREKYIKLSDGSIGILPQEWLDKFNRYLRYGEIKNNKIQLSKTKFSIIDELFENISDAKLIKELVDKRKKLKAFETIKSVKLPDGIKAQLRDYQKEGLNWLNFLHEFKWGGILADDMGLGKTLQAITILKQVAEYSQLPSLVVVPTTLIFNWQNELKKFCPSLKVLFHYGPDREKSNAHFSDFDVVVTTYGLVMNDIEFLKELSYNYIILDESQAIKNPSSKRYKAVNLLKAENRIAMTGTPIENGTFDLYAQMNFVNPGMFGNMKHFRDDFATPIDRDGDKIRAAELQKLISPFVLRRTKEQVATELPPKTEDVIYCAMDDEQRKVYDAYRNEIRNQLLNRIETDGIEKSKIHVLEGLMKLRQICDSPALLANEEDYGNDSVKIRELINHITKKTANHKIIVFSQFVKMLALIKSEIESLNIDYEYLDGQCSQKQRKESVKRFQEEENCRIFLISLKAGGTGINLTAADYVYIVDPWWNPAVENQAIDRCYRIGQNKKVFAYRMICKDTIEDKIVEYQQEKRDVAEDIIQTDESFMKQLSKDDVMGIFG